MQNFQLVEPIIKVSQIANLFLAQMKKKLKTETTAQKYFYWKK